MVRRTSALSETSWDEPALREMLVDQVSGFLKGSSAAIDPDKSFDEYGLDSIDAVIATELIGKKLGFELPPEFLLYHRSVNAIVGALLNNCLTDAPAGAPQAGEAPIFLFPGGGGRDESSLIRFRDQCVPALNFEVVSPGNWRDWIEHDMDFEKLASRACSHIKAIQAEGPVRLAGYSQGGQLAYATALTLARAGRKVEFVGLLDSSMQRASEFALLEVGVTRRALGLAGRYIKAVMRGINSYPKDTRIRVVRFIWRLCRGPADRKKFLMLVARTSALFRGAGGVRLNNYIQMILFAEFSRAWFEHRRRIDSPVFLFRSGDPGPPERGWSDCCSNLKVIQIAGTHLAIFDPQHLDELVTRFVAAANRQAQFNGLSADAQ